MCCKTVLELEPKNSTNYVMLSSIYAAIGNRHLYENVEQQKKVKGMKKQLGHTRIEVNNEVHTFVLHDQDHPQMIEIHAKLQRLSRIIHDVGFVPCTKFVLNDVKEEEKVFFFFVSPQRATGYCIWAHQHIFCTPHQIRKNLRVCEDCQTSTKLISKVVGKAITMRDVDQIHRIADGVCSCMDYW